MSKLTDQDLADWRAKRTGRPTAADLANNLAQQPAPAPTPATVVDPLPKATAPTTGGFNPLEGLTQEEVDMFDGAALNMLIKTASNAYKSALVDAVKAYERADQRVAALSEVGLVRRYHHECQSFAEGGTSIGVQCSHCGSSHTVLEDRISYCWPMDRELGCVEHADIYRCNTCNGLTRWQISTDNCGWTSFCAAPTNEDMVSKDREAQRQQEQTAARHGAGLATVVDGVEFSGFAGACRAHGIEYMAAYNKVQKHGGRALIAGHLFEIKNQPHTPL